MYGIGLRSKHYGDILEHPLHQIDFIECITENFATRGGRPRAILESIRQRKEICFHGVSMSIAGTDPINFEYLQSVRELAAHIQPLWISDHLCFSKAGGHYSHDLWPVPRNEASIRRTVERISQVQDFLGRQILLENISTYVQYAADDLPEPEFVAEIARRADCKILLDVNNIIVNARNHTFCPLDYLQALPLERVGQIHVAGHADFGTYLFDNHKGPVPSNVWALYQEVIRHCGEVPTLVEWDQDVPALEVVLEEAVTARISARNILQEAA